MLHVIQVLRNFIYFRIILLLSSLWGFIKIIMSFQTKSCCLLCHCNKVMEIYRGGEPANMKAKRVIADWLNWYMVQSFTILFVMKQNIIAAEF